MECSFPRFFQLEVCSDPRVVQETLACIAAEQRSGEQHRDSPEETDSCVVESQVAVAGVCWRRGLVSAGSVSGDA